MTRKIIIYNVNRGIRKIPEFEGFGLICLTLASIDAIRVRVNAVNWPSGSSTLGLHTPAAAFTGPTTEY